MPVVRGTTAAVALLAFIFTWGNFLDPLIYLDDRLFTLPLGLKSLAQLDRQYPPFLLAGAVVATAPVVAAFVVAQRFFLHDEERIGMARTCEGGLALGRAGALLVGTSCGGSGSGAKGNIDLPRLRRPGGIAGVPATSSRSTRAGTKARTCG